MLRPVPRAGDEPAHQLRYEGQGELLLLVGLGVLALGLGMVALPAERLGLDARAGADPLLWTWRLCGVLVGVMGLATVGYRRLVVLDREARTLTVSWGCFGLRRERVHELGGAVVTAFPLAATHDGDTFTEYPVELRRQGQVLLEVCRPDNEAEALARASELADFLGVPLETGQAP
jgi:hypothetical protein